MMNNMDDIGMKRENAMEQYSDRSNHERKFDALNPVDDEDRKLQTHKKKRKGKNNRGTVTAIKAYCRRVLLRRWSSSPLRSPSQSLSESESISLLMPRPGCRFGIRDAGPPLPLAPMPSCSI